MHDLAGTKKCNILQGLCKNYLIFTGAPEAGICKLLKILGKPYQQFGN